MNNKHNEPKYCVYKHTNRQNGRVYIGMTKNRPSRRWARGRGYATIGGDFYKDIVELGWDAFDHDIIASGLDYDSALKMEVELIESLKATNPKYGYNASIGGRRGVRGSRNGVSKSVQMVKNNKVIREFESLEEASRFVGGHKSNISSACKGHIKTAYGYQWRYS